MGLYGTIVDLTISNIRNMFNCGFVASFKLDRTTSNIFKIGAITKIGYRRKFTLISENLYSLTPLLSARKLKILIRTELDHILYIYI